MTHFLVSDDKPDGFKLEDILNLIRSDIVRRSTKIVGDDRAEAKTVLEHNIKILQLLTDSIHLAEESTRVLDRSFGKSVTGQPRIGQN